MLKRNMLAVAVCSSSLLLSTGLSAAVQKDKGEGSDSVHTWGPWNGVQTAAGPGTPGNLPLSLQFADAQNATEGAAFEAGVDTVVDNAGPREYHVYSKRGKYEQAFFDGLEITDKPGRKKDQVKFTVVTESGKTITVGMKNRRAVSEYGSYFYGKGKSFWQATGFDVDGTTPAFFAGMWSKRQSNKVWNNGAFVYGDSSPISAVLALPQGIEQNSVLANYSGYFSHGGSVDITVDFSGQGSWSGQFDMHGNDFNVANGRINGVDLTGSAIGESVVSGQVEASFFGSKAQYINGLADVDFGEEQIMDVFATANPQGNLEIID